MKKFFWIGCIISVVVGCCMAGPAGLAFPLIFIFCCFLPTWLITSIGKDVSEYNKKQEEKRKKKKAEEAAREAAKRDQERQQKAYEEYESNHDAIRSLDNVDILDFSSSNNLFTSGNNCIDFTLRNRNAYSVRVFVRYKYSDGWENKYMHGFDIGGNCMRKMNTLGKPWHKARDIEIVQVQ